ncbi:hypothetical protein E5C30_05800 [Alcaligenes faecalis]|nr:hypothetical protein [Alcaligenes faecalis]MBY6315970.1 hypothetical protein [Alcaligenes faecalis]MBY6390823.1 hypothetical protein [Alcaligenes faecalis]
MINARLDTILKKSPMWRGLLGKRVLVPADGWFEWTGEVGDKQPWFIHSKDGAPSIWLQSQHGNQARQMMLSTVLPLLPMHQRAAWSIFTTAGLWFSFLTLLANGCLKIAILNLHWSC